MQIYITPEGMSVASFDPNQHKSLIGRGYRLLDESIVTPVSDDNPVNINTATLKELSGLGLSLQTAKAIVAGRPWESTNGLLTIDGIDLTALETKITV